MTESGIFKIAIKLSPDARPAYLEQACGADAILRRDVESLLHEHDCLAGSPAEHPLMRSSSEGDKGCCSTERPSDFKREFGTTSSARAKRSSVEDRTGTTFRRAKGDRCLGAVDSFESRFSPRRTMFSSRNQPRRRSAFDDRGVAVRRDLESRLLHNDHRQSR